MEMVACQEKNFLREELLTKLLSLAKEEVIRRSKNVEKSLQDCIPYKEAKVVMAYYPLKGEVDILEMIRKAKNKRFCFPVMDLKTKDLFPFEVSNKVSDFVVGPYKVMQPDIGGAKKVDIKEIDIVLVPGLAFDYQKNRLGRGGGFYDRFLRKIKFPAKTIGVAFNFQIFKCLPIHPSLDVKVDYIATDNFFI